MTDPCNVTLGGRLAAPVGRQLVLALVAGGDRPPPLPLNHLLLRLVDHSLYAHTHGRGGNTHGSRIVSHLRRATQLATLYCVESLHGMRATSRPAEPSPFPSTRDARRMTARRGGAARIPTRRWRPVRRTSGGVAGRLSTRCATPSDGASPTPSAPPPTPSTLLALRRYKYRLTTGDWVRGSTARWGCWMPPPPSRNHWYLSCAGNSAFCVRRTP